MSSKLSDESFLSSMTHLLFVLESFKYQFEKTHETFYNFRRKIMSDQTKTIDELAKINLHFDTVAERHPDSNEHVAIYVDPTAVYAALDSDGYKPGKFEQDLMALYAGVTNGLEGSILALEDGVAHMFDDLGTKEGVRREIIDTLQDGVARRLIFKLPYDSEAGKAKSMTQARMFGKFHQEYQEPQEKDQK